MRNQHKKELEYALQHELVKQLPEMLSAIKEPRFTIKDVGVTHRWITHWHIKDLLVGEFEEQKWRKFNMIEYVWLKMIVQMRKFNLPLTTIKKVKEAILFEFPYSKYIDTKEGTGILKKINPSDKVEKIIHSDKFKKDISTDTTTFLESFILETLLMGSNYSVLINSKGDSLPMKENYYFEVKASKAGAKFLQGSFISISLFEILAEFINNNSLDLIYDELHLISEDEMKVIKALREDKIKSVNVKLKEPNKIELIEVTKEEKIDSPNKFFDLILKNGYQEIEIKTQNGKTVYCRNTRKTKI